MTGFIVGVSLLLVLGVLIWLQAKGAAIRKSQQLQNPSPPLKREAVSIKPLDVAILGLVLTIIAPALAGCWLLVETVIGWLRTAQWAPQTVADYIDPTFARSPSLAGWNKIVDWVFSCSAWLVCFSASAAAYFATMVCADTYHARAAARSAAQQRGTP